MESGRARRGEHRSPGERITIDFTRHGEISVVCVAGEFDPVVCASIRETPGILLRYRPSALVLDLTGIDLISSSGLSTLVDAVERASRSGVAFAVAANRVGVLRPLRATRIDSVVDVYPDAVAAVEAIEAPARSSAG